MPVYLRITVDGVPSEISTKRKWEPFRWDSRKGRASGSKDGLAAMKIKEMYAVHHEEIRELIGLKKKYADGYLSSLKAILRSPLSAEEVYRLAFGVYLEDDQLSRRPLSKLKKDILDEL